MNEAINRENLSEQEPEVKIETYSNEHKEEVIKLISGILEEEYGSKDKNRPDLENIPDVYQKDNGNFWVALNSEKLIGTVAIIDCGEKRGLLKRMYVDKEFRGKGAAAKLLETLLEFAKSKEYKQIFLETVKSQPAPNKFYTKNGFKEIKALPKELEKFQFSKLNDIFYELDLE